MKLPFQMCTGCGSSWNDKRLAEEKTLNPNLISCCPDRKMVDVYTHPSKDLTGEEIEKLAYQHRWNGDVEFARAILRKAQEK